MVFSSVPFICAFLPVVFLLCLVLPSTKARNVLLTCASLVFYAYGEPIYVLLMVASTVATWFAGILIGRVLGTGRLRVARVLCALAVVVDLGLLGVFKYADMAVDSFNVVFGMSFSLPQLALPIGISFYTFQALSYIIDVYRRDTPAERNLLHVALYISFFPQLIAGPIIKYHDVAHQISHRTITLTGVALGLRRFVVGLAKKVLIADVCAVAVDAIYAAPQSDINIAAAWIAALAYLVQIYFDFSGYSDMAIGMACMFGFEYKENFDYPYTSRSIREFWRRWHISLSTWFKEYLYIPLGGNRRGKGRAVVNKIIVFTCCGLWHGASWTFVVWGLLHGLFLLLEEYLPIHALPRVLGHLYSLVVVTLTFVIFRADTLPQGVYMLSQMVAGFHFEQAAVSLAFSQLNPQFIVTMILATLAATSLPKRLLSKFERSANPHRQVRLQTATFFAAFSLFVLCILAISSGAYSPFIYFRF